MRLLILSSELPPGPGGIGTHAAAIGTQLVALGWEVAIASPQDYAEESEIAEFNCRQAFRVERLKRIPFPPLEAIYRYRRCARVIREWRPDVLLASGDRAVWLASRLARIRRTPWLAVGHGTEFGTRRRWEFALTRRAYERATGIICVSEYTRSRMHGAGIHGRVEYVVPNGADPTVFHPEASPRRATSPKATVILTIGNVTERKGQEVVIRALPSLPGVRYEMIGLPTRAKELTALAEELGVADRIEFVGRASQEELVRRLYACDLFAMTSRNTKDGDFEGFGIAVVEAALCEKPAVVSEGSGLAEAILPGETGVLVRDGDAGDTARRIGELLADPPRMRRMGVAARVRALREQTWAQRVVQYEAALQRAVRIPKRKIVVVSDTPHQRRGGTIVGWGATVRELDELSSLFDELVHVAPVGDERPSPNALPYTSPRVRVRALRPSGGDRLVDKFSVLAAAYGYVRIALEEIEGGEVLHVRCPASMSMMIALLMPILRRPNKRWIKYAGDWRPSEEEPWTYELQRRWLGKPWHRAVVTVNGDWPDQPQHVRSFYNPCITERELTAARATASAKEFGYPVRMLFVGRLEHAKGVYCALDVLVQLHRRGFAVRLDLVGDGPAREELEQIARNKDVLHSVAFHGWLSHEGLAPHYAAAHLMLLPSYSEGWPKVLSEGMAFGVVPVASRVGSIPQFLVRFGIGAVASPGDTNGFAAAVLGYVNDAGRWKRESAKAVSGAEQFTFSHYLERVRGILRMEATPSGGIR